MIRLSLTPTNRWLELVPGVRLEVRPPTTALVNAALAEIGPVPGEAADADPAGRGTLLAKAIARRAIISWEGVVLEEGPDDAPAPVTPETVDALMDLWPVHAAFDRDYLQQALLLAAEGNASRPAPSGSSAGARPTAGPAKGSARPARRRGTGR